jgi:hypothetical protein
MKKSIAVLFVLIFSAGTYAATIGNWGSADYTVGSWNDASKWKEASVPAPSGNASNEIKATRQGSDMTVDGISGASFDYVERFTLASTNSAAPVILRFQQTSATTTFGMGEIRVGAPTSGTVNSYAEVYQTGGTLYLNDLYISRNKQQTSGTGGNGLYRISGGTLQVKSSATSSQGRLAIASYAETSGVAGIGKFVIDGAAATITMKHLFVGSASTAGGTGDATLQYILSSSGTVSKITVVDTSLDQVSASLTKLLIDAANAPTANVVLVENTGSAAVLGIFDTINGIAASEGAVVNIAGTNCTLTYLYDAATGSIGTGNDIALLVPEPATVVLLTIGLITITRKK